MRDILNVIISTDAPFEWAAKDVKTAMTEIFGTNGKFAARDAEPVTSAQAAAPDLLRMLEMSQQWLRKVAADYQDDPQNHGMSERAMKQHAWNAEVIARAKGEASA
jgi:hypothetical protein